MTGFGLLLSTLLLAAPPAEESVQEAYLLRTRLRIQQFEMSKIEVFLMGGGLDERTFSEDRSALQNADYWRQWTFVGPSGLSVFGAMLVPLFFSASNSPAPLIDALPYFAIGPTLGFGTWLWIRSRILNDKILKDQESRYKDIEAKYVQTISEIARKAFDPQNEADFLESLQLKIEKIAAETSQLNTDLLNELYRWRASLPTAKDGSHSSKTENIHSALTAEYADFLLKLNEHLRASISELSTKLDTYIEVLESQIQSQKNSQAVNPTRCQPAIAKLGFSPKI